VIVENDVVVSPDHERVGTGLGTTRDRLRLLYGPTADLQTSSNDGRFRVTIQVPARHLPQVATETSEPAHARAHR
jgi:hypothetical protein